MLRFASKFQKSREGTWAEKVYAGWEDCELRVRGPWWCCVERLEMKDQEVAPGFGVFYGFKLWGLAVYVRWNRSSRDDEA